MRDGASAFAASRWCDCRRVVGDRRSATPPGARHAGVDPRRGRVHGVLARGLRSWAVRDRAGTSAVRPTVPVIAVEGAMIPFRLELPHRDQMFRAGRIRGAAAAALVAALASAWPAAGFAQGTLRIGMTASDIPLTTGQADQGGEGQRFMANTVYDQLVMWDLSSADKPSVLVPGLALSWEADPRTARSGRFKLRPGVKYHDGSTFDAQAVVWNFEKLLNEKSPQFDRSRPRRAAPGSRRSRATRRSTRRPSRSSPRSRTRSCRTSSRGSRCPRPRTSRRWAATGTRTRRRRRAPVRGNWSPGPRASAPSWCRIPTTGTRRACRSSTSSCWCRCPRRTRASPRCARGRSTGSRRRRPTRSRA
jgi:hypothetical protein